MPESYLVYPFDEAIFKHMQINMRKSCKQVKIATESAIYIHPILGKPIKVVHDFETLRLEHLPGQIEVHLRAYASIHIEHNHIGQQPETHELCCNT